MFFLAMCRGSGRRRVGVVAGLSEAEVTHRSDSTKLYSLLMKIGEHRAKEVDDHHSYDAKCACMP